MRNSWDLPGRRRCAADGLVQRVVQRLAKKHFLDLRKASLRSTKSSSTARPIPEKLIIDAIAVVQGGAEMMGIQMK